MTANSAAASWPPWKQAIAKLRRHHIKCQSSLPSATMRGMDKLLLTPIEAANAIGVGTSKIYELLASGAIPSIRIGKSIRVPADKLREWIDNQITESAKKTG